MTQFGVQDEIRLHHRELKSIHQHRLGFIFGTNDTDHLIDIQKGDQQSVEQMQPVVDLFQAVFEALAHRCDTEFQPFLEQGAQILDLRPAIQTQHIHIDAIAALQIGGGEQMGHQFIDVDAIGSRDNHQPGGIFMI